MGGIGIAAVLLGAVNFQVGVVLAAFAAMVTAVVLVKINPQIVFFGLLLGYFFGGNIFGKLGLSSVGIPLYMGEIGIGAGVALLVATNVLEHREWWVVFGSMRPLLVPLVLFLMAGAVSVVVGGSGVVISEAAAVPMAITGTNLWVGDINSVFYTLKVAIRHFAFVYYTLMFFVPAIIIRSAAEFRNAIYVVVGALLLVIPVRQLGLIEHLAHYYHPDTPRPLTPENSSAHHQSKSNKLPKELTHSSLIESEGSALGTGVPSTLSCLLDGSNAQGARSSQADAQE